MAGELETQLLDLGLRAVNNDEPNTTTPLASREEIDVGSACRRVHVHTPGALLAQRKRFTQTRPPQRPVRKPLPVYEHRAGSSLLYFPSLLLP